ncbi:unnamed protein product [Sphagnum troendelagicum]|jgi:hypothetical protein|uniref:Uncharacterized protein n=1 Tax=Sphagnum jensenii TaxID=128206 RepID=A0ABP1A0K6_9BRYO
MIEGEDDDDDDDGERERRAPEEELCSSTRKKRGKSWKVLEGGERAGQAGAAKRGPGRTTRKVLEAAHRFP